MPLYNPPQSSGGGTINITQVIVDVGQIPVYAKSVIVDDGYVTTSSKIIAWQDAAGFSGHPADEAEMDALLCSGTPFDGYFNLIITAVPGPIVGTFLIDYLVS